MKKTILGMLAAGALSACSEPETLQGADCAYRQANEKEVCNNIDDDCDGKVDQILTTVICGLNNRGTQQWYCEDGKDTPLEECQDLDICVLGDQRAYYSGPKGTANVGECKDGIRVCTDAASGTQWDIIQSDVGPQQEACDGVDNDCDKIVDNYDKIPASPCWGSLLEEFRNVGACRNGWKGCGDADCRGVVFPKAEECDGVDNDCDGLVDEDFPARCKPADECVEGLIANDYFGPSGTENVGECKSGENVCVRDPDGIARWHETRKEVTPVEESCDFPLLDKDCNGKLAQEENRLDKAYVLFFYDTTGSFIFKHQSVAAAICNFPRRIAEDPTLEYYFGLVFVPAQRDDHNTKLMINYLPSQDFITACTTTDFTTYGANEIFWDALMDAAHPANRYGLNPKPVDVPERFVVFTDGEAPWSLRAYTQEYVTQEVKARGAQTSVFRPSTYAHITDAFQQIVSETGGKFYELQDSTLPGELAVGLEDIITKCK